MADPYLSWKSQDLPPGLLRQRRNLILFSVGTIIFVLGGGKNPETIRVLWSGVELTHPWILAVAWSLGFWYAYRRFLIYRPVITQSLFHERKEALYHLNSFQLWLKGKIKERENERPQLLIKPNHKHPNRVVLKLYESWGEWGRTATRVEGIKPEEMDVSWKEFSPFWRRARRYAVVHYKVTSDVILPEILAYVAAVLLLIRVYSDLIRTLQ